MPEHDIAKELAKLHHIRGVEFIHQLKWLSRLPVFKPVDGEKDIFAAEAYHGEDWSSLLDAARKAVTHGNKVYILPNPKRTKTADFIFENKGVYKLYDLKTISGRASLSNRLVESSDQTNRVLVNVRTTYNPRLMAAQIKKHFDSNPLAVEVLVYKGNKAISVSRRFTENPLYLFLFRQKYMK
ncbi:MAG: hypothetical protein J6Z26_07335 [Bacteroidales bacterium]|nr:hypothetical protein [Bacteroidales bacterium]